MRHARGFVLPALSVTVYAAIAAGAVILALGVAVKIQTSRLAAVKAAYAGFVAQTKALGEVAAANAKATEAADKQRKEKADAQHKKDSAAIASLSRRLRDARASRSYVPAAAASSSHPNGARISRAELERTIQRLDGGVSAVVEDGDKGRVELDTAKVWAQTLRP